MTPNGGFAGGGDPPAGAPATPIDGTTYNNAGRDFIYNAANTSWSNLMPTVTVTATFSQPTPFYGNFTDPWPDGLNANPYNLIRNKILVKPINSVDKESQGHNYFYWKKELVGFQVRYLILL